jgi:hypothetical protein
MTKIVKNIEDVKTLQPTLFWSLAKFDGRWLRKYKEKENDKSTRSNVIDFNAIRRRSTGRRRAACVGSRLTQRRPVTGSTWPRQARRMIMTAPIYEGNALSATVVIPNYNAEFKFVARAYLITPEGAEYESVDSNEVRHAIVMVVQNLRIE